MSKLMRREKHIYDKIDKMRKMCMSKLIRREEINM